MRRRERLSIPSERVTDADECRVAFTRRVTCTRKPQPQIQCKVQVNTTTTVLGNLIDNIGINQEMTDVMIVNIQRGSTNEQSLPALRRRQTRNNQLP